MVQLFYYLKDLLQEMDFKCAIKEFAYKINKNYLIIFLIQNKLFYIFKGINFKICFRAL